MKLISFLLLLVNVALSQTAPPVAGIQAIQHDGQTFITWADAGTGATGANYRYNLYRSTSGPITNLSSATIVQQGIYNNSGQLIGPKPYNQGTRQTVSNPMVKTQNSSAAVPIWTGVAVYTNVGTASAYYAVITHDITGATGDSPVVAGANATTSAVSESVAVIQPILQIPGTDASRQNGCLNCVVTPTSIGQPLWLRLHPSGGRAAAWGDYWAYWGNANMGYQDGTQSMFTIYQDVTGTVFNSGFANQLILTPQDAVWTVGGGGNNLYANAQSETYWYGLNSSASFPNSYTPATNTGAYIFPVTKNKLSFIVPWAIARYQADPNRIFASGESMGGYGSSVWSLRQPNLFAGVFMAIPIIGPWQKIPQVDYGAALGTVSVANGSTTVNWASGPPFGKYLGGPTTMFNLTINGTTKKVSLVNSGSQLTLDSPWNGAAGNYSYVTGYGNGCNGAPACGAGLTTVNTGSMDTLPDGTTLYNNETDTPMWISQNCGADIPFVAWSAGREDTTTAGMWNMSVLLANALATCHLGFSFVWSNGIHTTTTANLITTLSGNYAPQLQKNVSYPAFTGFSLDSNYGSGDPEVGDCNSGNSVSGPICYVNYGWKWASPTDTATLWSVTFSNSQVTSGPCPTTKCAPTATVSVTPRNTQSFNSAAGSTVYWKTTGGQSGSVTANTYGLATVSGVNLSAGSLTITFSTSPI